MDVYAYQAVLASIVYPLGHGLQAVGIILVARYVYAFLFHDEFEPIEQVVKHAKLGFVSLVSGFCLVHLFSMLSSFMTSMTQASNLSTEFRGANKR